MLLAEQAAEANNRANMILSAPSIDYVIVFSGDNAPPRPLFEHLFLRQRLFAACRRAGLRNCRKQPTTSPNG
jgi:hypothetical protein